MKNLEAGIILGPLAMFGSSFLLMTALEADLHAQVIPPAPVLPVNPGAAFLTHVPRLTSGSGSGGGGAVGAGKPVQPNPVATFSGTPYTLGATRTPTTTTPQAEEHVAVDPSNPSTLVAAISDFSSTRIIDDETGYNTTEYAVSLDNG